MKLKDIVRDIKTTRSSNGTGKEITGIFYNSQRVIPDSLFVAIKGNQSDGHNFIQEAIEKGAKAIIVERKDITVPAGITLMEVEDSRKTLARISGEFYGHPSMKMNVSGITGTKGKTTTSFILKKILEEADLPAGLIGTIHYQIGERSIPSTNTTPESIDIQKMLAEMADRNITHAVLEVSSHALEQGRVEGIDFDCAIFTNISGHEHLDYHKNFRNYLDAKLSFLSKYLRQSAKKEKAAVINLDDRYGGLFIKEAEKSGLGTYPFGIQRKTEFTPEKIRYSLSGTGFSIAGKDFHTPLLGQANLYNCLAAIAAAKSQKISDEAITSGLKNMTTVPGRMEFIEAGQDFKVVVDYAHTHQALSQLLSIVNMFRKGRTILVFGCGGNRDKSKRSLMGRIGARMSDVLILTSDNPRNEDQREIIAGIEKGIPFWHRNRYRVVPDRAAAIREAISLARKNDWVVIAGKGHETSQIIQNIFYPFDDRQVAKNSLLERLEKTGP